MADIASLLANSAQTNADFSAIGKLPQAYWQGRDEAFKNEGRDLFRDGVPKTADGQPDYAAMAQSFFKHGDAEKGIALQNLTLQQQQLQQYQEAATFSATGQPNLPPSSSRNGGTVVAPPLGQGGGGRSAAPATAPSGQYGGGDSPNSLISFFGRNGIPEQDQGSAANIIGGQLSQALGRRVDPNEPLDMNNPQVRQVLGGFVRSRQANGGGVPVARPAPSGPAPAAAVDPSPFAPAVAAGLIPPNIDPNRYVGGLKYRAAALPKGPAQASIQAQVDAINKVMGDAVAPTPDMKNARASGVSVREYHDRGDENTAKRDILTKSLIPELEKSRDKASAARDEIQSIHTAREQLDGPGGIFTGSAADTRLKLAKVASFLGVENSDKIANTEAFGSAIGSRVLSLVKGLGAGAGISNADRDYAAAMAGGNIKLDEKAIRRILDIGETAARTRIDQHNKLQGKMRKSNDYLADYDEVYRVDAPGAYKAQKPAANPASAFTKGQTATNPQTKQRVVFDGSQWVPLK